MTRQTIQYHPVFGHQFIPGLRARIEHEDGGYLIRVNQAGFRSDREFEAAKPPGVFRVLLFGDSVTAGYGVSNGRRYCDVLEQSIPGLEIYNCAIDGTGTAQQYLVFREIAAGIEHDLVVLGLWVENIRRVVARYRTWGTPEGESRVFAKPYFTLGPGDELELHNVPVPRDPLDPGALPAAEQAYLDRGGPRVWLRELVYRTSPRVRDALQRLTRYQPVPYYDRADGEQWRLMRAVLERWRDECAAPMVIFLIPQHQHIEQHASPKGYQARFAELHDPPRLTVHDPLPALQRPSRAERRAFRFASDNHPTVAGHRALAEALAPGIEAAMKAQVSQR